VRTTGSPPEGENLRDFLYICKELKAVPNAFGIAFSFIAAGGGSA
jgi:hypothetical protein